MPGLIDAHGGVEDVVVLVTVMCLSIGTPKNKQFSICPKWKIVYF